MIKVCCRGCFSDSVFSPPSKPPAVNSLQGLVDRLTIRRAFIITKMLVFFSILKLYKIFLRFNGIRKGVRGGIV